MKKLFYILASLAVGAVVGVFVFQALRNTTHLRTHGREGTVMIDQRYSESRWSRPLPLKKIHAYTATLEPRHEVIVESDQPLDENRSYSILFLTRDQADEARRTLLRPISGAIRLRTANDPVPTRKDPTDPMNRLMSKAMGSATGPKASQASPDSQDIDKNASVPFLIVRSGENFIQTLWGNSRIGEWIFVLAALLLFNALCRHAWKLPWGATVAAADKKDFVHPSLRAIDPDPPAKPRPPVEFTPSPPPEPPSPPAVPDNDPPLKLPRR